MKKKTTKQQKAQFIVASNELGELTVAVQGKRIDLMAIISHAAYDDSDIMELLMDAILAAVAIHLKREHNIDLADYVEAKMNQELGKYKKKKERVVN